MGCGASVGKKVNDSSSSEKGGKGTGEHSYSQIINDKCPLIRLDVSSTVKKLPRISGTFYSYDLRYCYVSQRGYYPNAMGKANQDSYLICENMLQDESCHVFGVFDGHGEYGDYCSHFAADKVSSLYHFLCVCMCVYVCLTTLSSHDSFIKPYHFYLTKHSKMICLRFLTSHFCSPPPLPHMLILLTIIDSLLFREGIEKQWWASRG